MALNGVSKGDETGTVGAVESANMRYCAKFRGKRSNRS